MPHCFIHLSVFEIKETSIVSKIGKLTIIFFYNFYGPIWRLENDARCIPFWIVSKHQKSPDSEKENCNFRIRDFSQNHP